MQGYVEMYQRLITKDIDPNGEGVVGKGSNAFNTFSPDGKKQLLAAQANEAFALLSKQMGKPGFEEKVKKLIEVFRAEQARIQQ
jgi:hypothetical protein